MTDLTIYPYRFEAIYKEKVWGGRAIETWLGKRLPAGKKIGESWEISDREDDMSVVLNGPDKGTSLRTLIEVERERLLGPEIARVFSDRFPLLVKYIDAEDILSVQVHPDDDYATENENGSWGKMEAWYIIHAQPGAYIYRGTKPGTTKEKFLELLKKNRLHECLHRMHVEAGDVIFIPPGCLHATGAGVLMAEIQQNSDLTYRVYDWGRVGLDGKPRELHLEKALDVIDWDLLEREELGENVGMPAEGASSKMLLECPKFAMERVMLKAPETNAAEVTQRFHILNIIDGHGKLNVPKEGMERIDIRQGETYLIPSDMQSYEIGTEENITAIRSYVPLPGD